MEIRRKTVSVTGMEPIKLVSVSRQEKKLSVPSFNYLFKLKESKPLDSVCLVMFQGCCTKTRWTAWWSPSATKASSGSTKASFPAGSEWPPGPSLSGSPSSRSEDTVEPNPGSQCVATPVLSKTYSRITFHFFLKLPWRLWTVETVYLPTSVTEMNAIY